MTEQENQTKESQEEEIPRKKVSEKQLQHLQKAREAKKRKHEDLIKTDLEILKQNYITIQTEIDQLKQIEQERTKKVKTHDYIIDPITIGCVSVLAFATLGTIYLSSVQTGEENMYSVL